MPEPVPIADGGVEVAVAFEHGPEGARLGGGDGASEEEGYHAVLGEACLSWGGYEA